MKAEKLDKLIVVGISISSIVMYIMLIINSLTIGWAIFVLVFWLLSVNMGICLNEYSHKYNKEV